MIDQERLDKLAKITEGFGNPFAETSFDKPLTIKEIVDSFEEEKVVTVAGRLTSKRGHGKSGFAHLTDHTGKLQFYAQQNTLGKKYYLYKFLDIGDIVGVKGKLFTTRTGE